MTKERLAVEGIPALLISPERPVGAVLFLHGAGGSKERTAELAGPLHELGLATLHPDALHHGERGGGNDVFKDKRRIVEAQLASIEEAPRLLAWLRARYPGLPLFLLGASMGGYVVHELLARGEAVAAAAVWMSAARPPAWLSPLLPEGFVPALERRTQYRGVPLLHLHGDADAIVPLRLAEETVERLRPHHRPGRLALVVFPGVGHAPRLEMAALSAGWFLRWRSE